MNFLWLKCRLAYLKPEVVCCKLGNGGKDVLL